MEWVNLITKRYNVLKPQSLCKSKNICVACHGAPANILLAFSIIPFFNELTIVKNKNSITLSKVFGTATILINNITTNAKKCRTL